MRSVFRVLNEALSILTKKERKKLAILTLIVMGMSLFELVGVVSILPFMSVATNPDVIETNSTLNFFYNYFNFQSTNRFLVALGVLSITALVIGNGFRALSNFLLIRFAHMQNYALSKRILESYLSMPYEYFLSQNSSNLTRNVINEVQQVVTQFFIPFFRAIGRLFAASFIIIFLIVIDPLLALVTSFTLGGAYVVIYKLLKNKIEKMGKERVQMNKRRVRIVSEASGGIKEIKLMNKENVYLDEFARPSIQFARAQSFSAVISELPRHLLEVIAFGGILAISIYLIGTRAHYSEALTITSLYAFAGYKLMPALQEIFNAATKIKFSLPTLREVKKNIKEEIFLTQPQSKEHLSFEDTVELKNIHFSYKGSKTQALNGVSFSVKANTTVGVIGATGSGKTTLIDVILGLLKPSMGEIFIDGKKLDRSNLAAWQANIGYVPQFIYLTDDTVAANIAFGVKAEDRDDEKIKEVSRLAQISGFIETQMPKGYETVVGERGIRLSGGQRQRIGIARALYHNPSLLVFDEATSALDSQTESEVMKAIESLSGQKTIIMIAHRLSTLKSCDVIIELDRGAVKNQEDKVLEVTV